MLHRWALWCRRDDSSEILRDCGLTGAGSPRTPAHVIFDRGAERAEDVGGYAREHAPAADDVSAVVDAFMLALAAISPGIFHALLARHTRIVRGEFIDMRSESEVAQVLYGLRRSGAWKRLAQDCEVGYGALRRWLESPQGAIRQDAVAWQGS